MGETTKTGATPEVQPELHQYPRARRYVIRLQLEAGIPSDVVKIVVEKLTKNVNESHLREIFGAYGSIQDLDLPINRQCIHPLCFYKDSIG